MPLRTTAMACHQHRPHAFDSAHRAVAVVLYAALAVVGVVQGQVQEVGLYATQTFESCSATSTGSTSECGSRCSFRDAGFRELMLTILACIMQPRCSDGWSDVGRKLQHRHGCTTRQHALSMLAASVWFDTGTMIGMFSMAGAHYGLHQMHCCSHAFHHTSRMGVNHKRSCTDTSIPLAGSTWPPMHPGAYPSPISC